MVVGSDGDDHEIAVLGQWPRRSCSSAMVRGHRDDLALVIRDDDLTIERRLLDVVTPADETRDDLGHFVEPWRPLVAEANDSRAVSSSDLASRRITSWHW